MRRSIPFLLLTLLLFLLPRSGQAQLGLNVSLTTSGYRFQAGDTAVVTPANVKKKASRQKADAPESFRAAVIVANFSRTDVPFNFPNTAAAARHWTFRVFDSAGAQVWISDSDDTVNPMATPVTLKHGSAWRRSVDVPLKVNDTWLVPGRYTLEASIAGDPAIGSTTAFEVVSSTVTSTDTGIKGQVFQQTFPIYIPGGPILDPLPLTGGASANAASSTTANFVLAPVGVKATVTVTQYYPPGVQPLVAPRSWTVTTDDSGNYTISVPPRQYNVTAVATSGTVVPPPVALSNSATSAGSANAQLLIGPISLPVKVVAGQYTVKNVYLTKYITTSPTLPDDTGVTGTVDLPTDPDSASDVAPAPLVGATVRLVKVFAGGPIIYTPNIALIRYPFDLPQTTTTDENGAFKFNAFAGDYLLTVYQNVTPGTYDATTSLPVTSARITITSGQFTNVALQATALAKSDAVQVSTVDSADLQYVSTATIGASTTTLLVASGTVPTTGWTGVALRPRPSTSTTLAEFDLVGVPPDSTDPAGSVAAATPQSVTASLPIVTTGVTTIRVYAQNNSKEIGLVIPLALSAGATQ